MQKKLGVFHSRIILLGPTSSGKTTMLKVFANFIRSTRGCHGFSLKIFKDISNLVEFRSFNDFLNFKKMTTRPEVVQANFLTEKTHLKAEIMATGGSDQGPIWQNTIKSIRNSPYQSPLIGVVDVTRIDKSVEYLKSVLRKFPSRNFSAILLHKYDLMDDSIQIPERILGLPPVPTSIYLKDYLKSLTLQFINQMLVALRQIQDSGMEDTSIASRRPNLFEEQIRCFENFKNDDLVSKFATLLLQVIQTQNEV